MARLCGGGPEQFVAARVQHLVMEFWGGTTEDSSHGDS